MTGTDPERPAGPDAGAATLIGLDDVIVHEVERALDQDDTTLATALAVPLHPGDLADLLQLLDKDRRQRLVGALGAQLDPETLSHLDETVRDEILAELGPQQASAVVAQLETDDAVEVLGDLDESEREAILAALPLPDRAAIEAGLAFPDDSAGRLMQRELVAMPDYWTVGQAIDYLRATPDLPDEFHDILIVDPRYRPKGSVPLSRILRSPRATRVSTIAHGELRPIPASMDQEQVAFMFRQYGLVSAPVVDGDGRLLGVITVDDVVDVIDEEAEEDLMKMGGVSATDLFAAPLPTARKRLPWLLVNVVTAITASSVIAHFAGAIEKVVALAVLMPIVASIGGNAGTQALTVAVRALAVKELTIANVWRVLRKELMVGGLNGLIFLTLGAVLVALWSGDTVLAAVFGGALLINLMTASLAGIMLPFVIDRLKLDPAVASGVFVTTVTDCIGFFAFLGLAVHFLF